jgi:hypothetical protein
VIKYDCAYQVKPVREGAETKGEHRMEERNIIIIIYLKVCEMV